MDFEIISDTSCDLTPSQAQKLGISLVPFYFSFDGETYYKEGHSITSDDFFNKLKNEDLYPKTSLPSVQDYIDMFEKNLKEGKDILCFTISSKFSGSHQSALTAKLSIVDDYPDRRIEIYDSLAATAAQGVLVKHAAKLKSEDKSMDEIIGILDSGNLFHKIFFTVDSLEYLAKGGRLGKGASLLGTLLDVKPILNLYNGELFPVAKVRKKKKAFETILEQAYECANEFDAFSLTLVYSLEGEDTQVLENLIKDKFGDDVKLNKSQLGTTIGVHTGPAVIGILVSNF